MEIPIYNYWMEKSLARWINMRYYNFIKFEDYKGRKDVISVKEVNV